jgi:hypothetical protein
MIIHLWIKLLHLHELFANDGVVPYWSAHFFPILCFGQRLHSTSCFKFAELVCLASFRDVVQVLAAVPRDSIWL